jgi:hypothetical protein
MESRPKEVILAAAKLAIGMVTSRDDAELAVRRILLCGYLRHDVSLIMTENTQKRCFIQRGSGDSPAHAFGAAVAVSVVVPGLGLVVAGPIAAAVAGVTCGGCDGLTGVLIGAGIPEQRARFYEGCLADGGILIGVYAANARSAEAIETILEDFSGVQIRTTSVGRRAFDSYF